MDHCCPGCVAIQAEVVCGVLQKGLLVQWLTYGVLSAELIAPAQIIRSFGKFTRA